MATIRLRVITPKTIVFEEEVLSVTAPSSEGEITVLPRHARLFSLLTEVIITIRMKSAEETLAIGSGYLQTDGKELNVLVSRAYGQDKINEKVTEQAIENAKKILDKSTDVKEREDAAMLLRRSIVDLKLLKHRRKKML